MIRSYTNLLTPLEIEQLLQHPQTVTSREQLGTLSRVDFSVAIPDEARERMSRAMGLHLTGTIPLRWIRGDSVPHVDRAADHRSFDTTHLVYLTDSDGVFSVGHQEHPIRAGHGYSFRHGLVHGTRNTTQDRLLMGPFNERQVPVGMLQTGIFYFKSQEVGFEHLAYVQTELSGKLLTVDEINERNRDPSSPFHQAAIPVPRGQQQVGWKVLASYSTGSGTIDGMIPRDGDVIPMNAVFLLAIEESIALCPVFADRAPRWIRLGKAKWPRPLHARSTLAFSN